MSDRHCLNCGHKLELNYCGNCGQKAETHRFSLKHMIVHDLVHGLFHIDKGFFYTAREVLLRPGKSIRAYINGKRISHYNAFGFLLLLIAVYHLLFSSNGFQLSEFLPSKKGSTLLDQVQAFMMDNYKFLVMMVIPINACLSYLVFRRARQNFAEHLMLNVYKQGGELLANIIMFVAFFPFRHTPAAHFMFAILGLVPQIYNAVFYVQYFRPDYKSIFSTLTRALLVQIISNMFMGLIAYFIVRYIVDGHAHP